MDKETMAEYAANGDLDLDEDILYMHNIAEEKADKEEVERCLLGLEYPKSRREILAHAIKNQCDVNVIHSLKHALRNRYNSLVEIESEISR